MTIRRKHCPTNFFNEHRRLLEFTKVNDIIFDIFAIFFRFYFILALFFSVFNLSTINRRKQFDNLIGNVKKIEKKTVYITELYVFRWRRVAERKIGFCERRHVRYFEMCIETVFESQSVH